MDSFQELLKRRTLRDTRRTVEIGGVSFTLHDISIQNRMKEDEIYEKNKTVWELLPRGLCFIYVGEELVWTIRGHPKFGNFGEFKHIDFPIVQYVFTTKENGECGHFSSFVLGGVEYWVVGSKNVHMVLRKENASEDIERYRTEVRYTYAIQMAELLLKYDLEKASKFCQQERVTLSYEGCFQNKQHFVEYKEDCAFFFSITEEYDGHKLTKYNPIRTKEIFDELGLPSVTSVSVANALDEKKELEERVEQEQNSEGAVVCCLDEFGNTVYVYKHKNFDYVFKRALREKMKNKASRDEILERFGRLHIKHPRHEDMKHWALAFNEWWHSSGCPEELFEKWVEYEQRFTMGASSK